MTRLLICSTVSLLVVSCSTNTPRLPSATDAETRTNDDATARPDARGDDAGERQDSGRIAVDAGGGILDTGMEILDALPFADASEAGVIDSDAEVADFGTTPGGDTGIPDFGVMPPRPDGGFPPLPDTGLPPLPDGSFPPLPDGSFPPLGDGGFMLPDFGVRMVDVRAVMGTAVAHLNLMPPIAMDPIDFAIDLEYDNRTPMNEQISIVNADIFLFSLTGGILQQSFSMQPVHNAPPGVTVKQHTKVAGSGMPASIPNPSGLCGGMGTVNIMMSNGVMVLGLVNIMCTM